MSPKDAKMIVQWYTIGISKDSDYISLTDIAKKFDDLGLIDNWLRNKNTVEFLWVWERMNNPEFNSLEFEGIMKEAGLNRFTLSVKKWKERVNWVGMKAKTGLFGWTYAHVDIALEFASWISPEFKYFIFKEFQRLKNEEAERLASWWSTKRILAKVNYKIHTDAIKDHLIWVFDFDRFVYANEADMLNVIVYWETHADWQKKNKWAEWNQRDNGSVDQLVVISNLETMNALLLSQGMKDRKERAKILYTEAQRLTQSLLSNKSIKKLK